MTFLSALDPRKSLRARLGLTFGGLTFLSIALLVLLIDVYTGLNHDLWGVGEPVINLLQRQILLYGLIVSLAFVALGWTIAGRMTRPLQALADLAAQGDLEKLASLPPGEDEAAQLAHALARLLRDLHGQTTALALAKTDLEIRVAERTRKLTAVSDMLNVSLSLDELGIILQNALERLLPAVEAQAGLIHLLDDRDGMLSLAAHHGLAAPAVPDVQQLSAETAVFQTIIQQQTAVHIMNPAADPRAQALPWIVPFAYFWGAPIQTQDQVWGVLSVLGGGAAQIGPAELDMLASLVPQIGITVERFYLRQQAEQLAVLDERHRLARELHDSVTQALYSATLFAEAGQRMAKAGDMEKVQAYLDEVGDTSRQALREMRLLLHKLRPSSLAREGLIPTLEQRLKAVESRAGIEPELVVENWGALPPSVEDTLYYVLSETLNNALKHAHATAVTVRLSQTADGEIVLCVCDNGRGFDLETAVNAGGLGLASMREWLAPLHGDLTIDTGPGQGTTVQIRLPYPSAIG